MSSLVCRTNFRSNQPGLKPISKRTIAVRNESKSSAEKMINQDECGQAVTSDTCRTKPSFGSSDRSGSPVSGKDDLRPGRLLAVLQPQAFATRAKTHTIGPADTPHRVRQQLRGLVF